MDWRILVQMLIARILVCGALSQSSSYNDNSISTPSASTVNAFADNFRNHFENGMNRLQESDWSTPQQEVDEGRGYERNDKMAAKLTAENDKMSDDGRQTRLKLKSSSSRSKRQGLSFVERFHQQALSPGATIELWCAARGATHITWSRDGMLLTISSAATSSPGTNGLVPFARSIYNISRALPEDAGLYSCSAVSRNNDSIAHEARIDIFGPPYIRPMGPVKALAGSKVTVHCPYYGYPISKIQWEHDGKVIGNDYILSPRYKRSSGPNKMSNGDDMSNREDGKAHNDTKRQEDTFNKRTKRSIASNQNGILIIEDVNSDDNGGMYTCSVSNPSGEMAKRAFELLVMEAPVLDNFAFGQNLQEGEIAQATCTVRSGDTPIFFSWMKDGLPIPNSLKVEERSLELFSVLSIRKVKLQHCGKYTCIATNHAARVNKSAELYIKVAPKWVEEPENTSLILGKMGQVKCSANGYPQPQVHWLKREDNNWRPVLELRGSGLLSLPNGSLVLELVTSRDAGLYSCRVENGVGQPLHKDIFIAVNKPVTFEFQSKNVTTRIGHPVTVLCEAFGDHPIRIVWYHNAKPLDNGFNRAKISNHQTPNGVISEVLIGSSSSKDSGEYQCRASNPHGVAQTIVYLIVQEPPGPPIEISVEDVRGRTVRVGWRASAITPLLYLLQYAPHHHLRWDTATSINVTHIPEQSRQFTEIINLQPATPYAIRISSIGPAGSSPFTRPLLFTTLEEVPSSSPLSVHAISGPGPGELQVSWLSPPAHSLHGILLGYIIKAIPQIIHHSDDKTVIHKVSPTSQQTTLTGLLKNSRYSISISCFNSAGSGPPSPLVFVDTPEGVPEVVPEEVECLAVSSTSLRISWRPLPHHLQGGAMLGYAVNYIGTDGLQFNTSSVHSSVQLDGLNKFTNYSVWVAGYCSKGSGPSSSPILCTTLEDLPSPPAKIKILVSTSTSIVISWLPPLQPNGRILYYSVYVRLAHGGGTVQSYRITPDLDFKPSGRQETLLHAVRGLDQGKKYEAWVSAATILGEGEPSRTVTAEPNDRVVAGVSSLGGRVVAGSSTNLKLSCIAQGNPQPRTVWYHNSRVITHHPSFTLNNDDSLLINDISPSLEGNYTCVAKNLFGWDSVSYIVSVISPPPPPRLRASPDRRGLVLHWSPPNHTTPILGYILKWKTENEDWNVEHLAGSATDNKVLTSLMCGKQYEVQLVAQGVVGLSRPAIAVATTLGGQMISPTGTDWITSNSSHIFLLLDAWEDGQCGVPRWSVDYRLLGSKLWLQPDPLPEVTNNHLILSRLHSGRWYQLRVSSTNLAGPTTAIYTVATKTVTGESIGPPNEPLDASVLVMVCSCVLLLLCMLICIFVAVQKHRHKVLCGSVSNNQYKTSTDGRGMPRSESESQPCQRIYSSPVCTRKTSKASTEMFEISPYAQFTMGFQTFGHVENQDRPGYMKSKPGIYNTGDTSFQACSESDDSDSLSKSATVVKGPSKMCRVQYHR